MARSFAASRGFATGRGQRVAGTVGGGGGTPPPDPAPTITAGPEIVLPIGTTTVALYITTNQPTRAWYEYGPTTSYGSESTHELNYLAAHMQIIGDGEPALTPGTTYHFRPVVENQGGLRTFGSDIAVTTAGGVVSCGDLQAQIDAAAAGSTLNVTGCTFGSGVTINKALTLVGGTINVATNTSAVTITANNVTLDGVTITGPGNTATGSKPNYTLYNINSRGIYVSGSGVSRRTGIVIRNCTVSGFRGWGIYLLYPQGALIEDNTVTDIVYTGIGVYSDISSIVSGNLVQRIGDQGCFPSVAAIHNAYGIVTSRIDTVSHVVATGTIIRDNEVTDIPTWHAYDTHGGQNHQWLRNISRRCNRGIFITSSGSTSPGAQVITDNQLLQPWSGNSVYVAFPSSPFNMQAMFFIGGGPHTGSGNVIDGWPVAFNGSHSLTGTTITGSAPTTPYYAPFS